MTPAQHVIIDGPNVLHAWPELRPLLKRDRSAARDRLVSMATALHDAESCRVTVVFDGRGAEVVVEHPGGQGSLTVIFTSSGLTADDVIEQMVGQAREPQGCVVVTADGAERSTVEALGAAAISPGELAARMARASDRVRASVARLNGGAKGARR